MCKGGYMFLGIWLLCAFLAYGILLAYWIGEFPGFNNREDAGFSMGISLLGGPITLVIAFFVTGFCRHGFKLYWK